jgi:hypothetical protein
MAGFDKVDPANSCLLGSAASAGGLAAEGGAGFRHDQEMPARVLDEGIAVIREYALHRQNGVAGKVRVLTS